MSDPKAIINYAILCDDVRREQNGKEILIGLYNDTIYFREFPSVSNFKFVIGTTSKGKGSTDIEIQAIADPNNRLIIQVAGEINFTRAGRGLFSFALPMNFEEPGMLKMRVKLNKRWKTWLTFKVDLQPSVHE